MPSSKQLIVMHMDRHQKIALDIWEKGEGRRKESTERREECTEKKGRVKVEEGKSVRRRREE